MSSDRSVLCLHSALHAKPYSLSIQAPGDSCAINVNH